MKNIVSITLKLFVITVVAAALLGVVYSITKAPIAQQVEKAAEEARLAAFPEAASFEDTKAEIPGEYDIIKSVYNALDKDGSVIGVTLSITTRGYSSGLNMTVGLGADGKLKGVIVGDNNETQGLGKKAAEPAFNGQFPGKPYDKELKVVKSSPGDNDIQAITGATITSKAVANAVNTAAEFYKQLGGAK
jgi:electron transport complex protein RnfG